MHIRPYPLSWPSTLLRLLAMTLLAGTAWVHAQERVPAYPSKPVRIVVPYPSGNTPDALARMLAGRLTDTMGQQFIVDNRPGAGGVVALDYVAKSAPDGHTLLVGDPGPLLITPATTPNLPYDVNRDLVSVNLVVNSYFFLVVPATMGVSNLNEFLALVKSRPGKMNYASTGTGNIHHLMFETFKYDAGIDLVQVPYKGGAQGVADMLGGQIEVILSGMPAIAAHVKSGRLKILGVAAAKRVAAAPDVSTLAELGYPSMVFNGYLGILAPAGTPTPIISRLSAQLTMVIREPDVVAKIEPLGMEAAGTSPQEAAAYWRAEGERFARAFKIIGSQAK
jgi:tripartite-type tricarboxylate transporter receptor subunit TctC